MNASAVKHRGDPVTFADRYSTAPRPFAAWALAQLDLSEVTAAADVGCGQGRFTLPLACTLADRLTASAAWVKVSGVDVDGAELGVLRTAAGREGLPIRATQGDALDPSVFPADSLDLVMLKFVLHLMPRGDVHNCLENAQAWLRRGGSLLISGYGSRHKSNAFGWLREALTLLGRSREEARQLSDRRQRSFGSRSFVLEDGLRALTPAFDVVTYRRFEDTLVVGSRRTAAPRRRRPDARTVRR
jgi:SAM-dependent methyltransferase